MELSIPQIAAIIVTVLIARALSKKRKKKDQDDIDSLYPPDMKQKDRVPDRKTNLYEGVERKQPKRSMKASDLEDLYPPLKSKTKEFTDEKNHK